MVIGDMRGTMADEERQEGGQQKFCQFGVIQLLQCINFSHPGYLLPTSI